MCVYHNLIIFQLHRNYVFLYNNGYTVELLTVKFLCQFWRATQQTNTINKQNTKRLRTIVGRYYTICDDILLIFTFVKINLRTKPYNFKKKKSLEWRTTCNKHCRFSLQAPKVNSTMHYFTTSLLHATVMLSTSCTKNHLPAIM